MVDEVEKQAILCSQALVLLIDRSNDQGLVRCFYRGT